jgi:tetratricopeptide (TPR) repeat protein
MLFDLRGAGRRRTVKFVYLALAFLMFAGFVGFSVGSNVSGGIIDAITQGSGGGTDTTANTFRDRVRAAERKTRTNPKDAAAWAALARAQFQLAGVGDNFDTAKSAYTRSGAARLRAADRAWQRHLSLAPKHPDDRVATIMVQVYSALGNAAKAVQAQEIVTEARPKATTFAQLAVYAYQAGQTRKGDLARDKALELTPKDQRAALKSQLQQARTSAAAVTGQPTPTATATPRSSG